jgi:hypothetical protein
MRALSFVAMVVMAVALGCASGTTSTATPAPAAQAAVGPASSVNGTIQNYTRTPTGEVDGFVLDSGQRVRFPASFGPKVSEQFPPNMAVQVTGRRTTDPDGRQVIEAEQITNPASRATLDLTAAPSAVGGSGTSAEPQNPVAPSPAPQQVTPPPPTQR